MEQLTLFPLADFTVNLPAPAPPAIVAELESLMAGSVVHLGVAPAAWSYLRLRWQGLEPYVPQAGTSPFLRDVVHYVAVAAVERGVQPLEALAMGRIAMDAFQTHYNGHQFYIPLPDTRNERYAAILSDFKEFGTDEAARRHGCSFQLILRVRRMALKRGRRLRHAG